MANPADVVTDHGGSLARAEALFPGAPKPWMDLSTGINPHSYPLFDLPATAFSRLPEAMRERELAALAGKAYGAPDAAHVVPAPGTQILLPMVMALRAPGRARVLSPTYAEHHRAAAIAGHAVEEVSHFDALHDADLAVVVNPNNPDGRVAPRAALLELARHMKAKGGLLVVDEAFMDVGPAGESLAGDVSTGGIVVLRSFGKFFGLAGVRLGFAITSEAAAARLLVELGPWAVAGPALEYGIRALGDRAWQVTMRARLDAEAARLDALLRRAGISSISGTSLFRLAETESAGALFDSLGRQGILVRNFTNMPCALRFGLPGHDDEFRRLSDALDGWPGAKEPGA